MTRNAGDSTHARPFDTAFYNRLRSLLETATVRETHLLDEPSGASFRVDAGELLTVELLEGAQIVNMILLNASDPDERFWAHQTCLIDGLFLTRWSRLWGTMARLRPLMTVLEDTVAVRPLPGVTAAKHHPVLGGSGTPAAWYYSGGRMGAKSVWSQFARTLAERSLGPELIVDDASLFQKAAVEGGRLETYPSDALASDRLTFFAEIDLIVVLALSPSVDGSVPPSRVRSRPRPVQATIIEAIAEPVGWPYAGIGYPDLSLYLDASGVRSTDAVPTPGL